MLVYVKDHQNVTFSLPKSLLRQFRVYAASRNRSMTSLAEQAIRKMLMERDEYEQAGKRLLDRMRNAPDLGTKGKVSWTREELYER